jgi:flagella basal body P-ring formation protein FlgA
MKPVLCASLCTCLSAAAPLLARAEPPVQSLAEIRSAAAAFVSAQLPGGVRAEAAVLDARVRLPACAEPLQATAASPPGNNAWSVAVRCAAPQTWTLYVPVRVSDRRPVVVLRRALAPGLPIPADALALETRDSAALPFGYLSDPAQAAGKQLRRPLPSGATLTPDAVGVAPQIRRGQLVTLLGRSGGLEIRAEGKALADAGTGERVSVENTSSRRTVVGVVRGDGVVEVGI